MEKSHIVKQGLAILFILGIFLLAFLVLKPIIIPIIFGLLLGYIFSPVYKRIKNLLGGSNISAFLLLGGLTILIIVPLIFLIPLLGRQLFEIYVLLQNTNFNEILNRFFEGDLASNMAIQLDNIFGNIFPALVGGVSDFLKNRTKKMIAISKQVKVKIHSSTSKGILNSFIIGNSNIIMAFTSLYLLK